jgi:DNA polymerase-3 subunit alpha
MGGYQKFLDRAQGLQKDRELGQSSLFDLGPSTETVVKLEETKPWNRTASLAYEKEVLGFYLSDHPLKGFDTLSEIWVTCKVVDLQNKCQLRGLQSGKLCRLLRRTGKIAMLLKSVWSWRV